MYVNLEQLALSGLSADDFLNLIAIRQGDDFYVQTIGVDDIVRYVGDGFIEAKKNGKPVLTPKGKGLMEAIETPGITEEISETLKILVDIYERKQKDIGKSLKEAERRLIWFMGNTRFKKKLIIEAVEAYVEESGDYTLSLCNLLWKPPSIAFSVHMNLRDSKLFDIIARKYNFNMDEYFKEKKGKEMEWLIAVSKLPDPPARGGEECFFTYSPAKDKERLLEIKRLFFRKLRRK